MLSFGDVSLNLGQFVNRVLRPVLTQIQDDTAPLNDVINVLDKPLPVLTDLSNLVGGGDVTLMGLAQLAAKYAGVGPIADLIAQDRDVRSGFQHFRLEGVRADHARRF